MIKIFISPEHSPEKGYALQVLFNELLGLPIWVSLDSGMEHYRIELPNGNNIIIEDAFFGQRDENLPYSAQELPLKVPFVRYGDITTPVLFGHAGYTETPQEIRFSADWVAAAFFMLTRWEEAVVSERDQYGRFPAKASLAFKNNFLQYPVVHQWAEILWAAMLKLGLPEGVKRQRKSTFVLSCDVDHPRLWWQPWQRIRTVLGAFSRKNTLYELKYWAKNDFFLKKDPFDTFDELMEMAGGEQVQFNFLSDRPRHFDCWYDLQHPFVLQLLQKIHQKGHTIGFHPSREAATDRHRFEAELTALRNIAPGPVTTGRHHYLCFESPDTWQMWEDFGLKMDSTVGYSDMPGFRTGMCVAYGLFNFKTRQQLGLVEQPLVAMDMTFTGYLKNDPLETIEKLQYLRDQTLIYNGQFTLLWHNSSIHTPVWQPYWDELNKLTSKYAQLD